MPRPGRSDPRLPQFLPPPRHEGVPLRRRARRPSSPAPITAGATAPTGGWSACRISARPTIRGSTRRNGASSRSRNCATTRARSGRPGTRPRRPSPNISATSPAISTCSSTAGTGARARPRCSAASRSGWCRATGSSRRRTSAATPITISATARSIWPASGRRAPAVATWASATRAASCMSAFPTAATRRSTTSCRLASRRRPPT